jgi:acetyl-CoA synthetase (ADP-forming)
MLAAAGLRVTRERRVHSVTEAREAAEALGYPVVLKGVSRKVIHKSDAGLVRLGLRDRSAVDAAFPEVFSELKRLDPDADACLVSEMITDGLELILGVKHDPQFGPVVMVGAGGTLAELIRDVEVTLAPLSAETAASMLKRLRIWPLLEGFRGYPARDVGAVIDALVKLGQLASALEGRLLELDINPLLVRGKGEGAVAADARAVIA